MNFRTCFALLAVALPTALVACAEAPETDDVSEESSEEAALTGRQQLQGSWSVDPTVDATGGIHLRPSGQYFSDLSPLQRAEGSYTVNKRNHTLTLKTGSRETVYRTIYTPAPILNGFPGPNGFPRTFARLELQQLRPMTTVAVIHKLVQVDSWCSSAVDCMLEEQDNTWNPTETEGTPSCNTHHSCEMKASGQDTVVATCGAAHILNGFVDPSSIYSAEIVQHVATILNGFVRPTMKVVIKKGNNVETTLDNCTGDLERWNLHCTQRNAPVGARQMFELTDKANGKGAYTTGALTPTAPVFVRDFRCSVEQ